MITEAIRDGMSSNVYSRNQTKANILILLYTKKKKEVKVEDERKQIETRKVHSFLPNGQ